MLVNPINFRLSASIFWNSTWSLYKNGNYKYLFYSDLVFFEFFMFFFKKTLIKGHFDNYATHLRLYRVEGKIILNLYYHTIKEEWYQDELDILLKGTKKPLYVDTILKKKKLKKVKKISYLEKVNQEPLNALVPHFLLNKIVKIIENNLKDLLFNYSIISNVVVENLKKNLQKRINLNWEKNLNLFFEKEFKYFYNSLNFRNMLKIYYFDLSEIYINFLLNNITLIKKYKQNSLIKNNIDLLNQNLENKILVKKEIKSIKKEIKPIKKVIKPIKKEIKPIKKEIKPIEKVINARIKKLINLRFNQNIKKRNKKKKNFNFLKKQAKKYNLYALNLKLRFKLKPKRKKKKSKKK